MFNINPKQLGQPTAIIFDEVPKCITCRSREVTTVGIIDWAVMGGTEEHPSTHEAFYACKDHADHLKSTLPTVVRNALGGGLLQAFMSAGTETEPEDEK